MLSQHGQNVKHVCMFTRAISTADGSLKLWDLRKLKAPLAVADGLSSNYSMTQVGVGIVLPFC